MAEKKFIYENLDSESEEILSETFTSQFRKNNVKCEGFFFSQSFENFADAIRKMEIRDDDVWVCTFPKSGTTWTQEMIWCLANGQNHESVQKVLYKRYSFLELSTLFDPTDKEYPIPENSVEMVEKHDSPRFIKTHLPFDLLPQKLQNFSTNAKVIHVMRNPRDTAISYYHHYRSFHDYNGSLSQFVELFFKGLVYFGPYPAHLKGYLAHEGNPKILFLKYEEMQKDLKSVVYKTANYINKSISEKDVEKLLEHLSFSNMKQNPAVNLVLKLEVKRKSNLAEEDDKRFMRRGIVGDWKGRLDPELCERFQKWEEENMKEINFIFSI